MSEKTVHDALAAAQAELKNPEKKREADTGKYKYKYADIGDVLETVLPILAKHGISMTQPTIIRDGSIILKTVLTHNGQSIESEYPVCSLNGNHQAMGSAMTYARRYALTSLIGIAAVDDTDGEGAAPAGDGPRVKMTSAQAKQEINWAEIQASIDGANTFAKLDNMAERVEERKGVWPDTYYHKARERIEFNRLELAGQRLGNAKDLDALNEAFGELEVVLDGKVPYDDLAGLHRKSESRIMNGSDAVQNMLAG